MILRPHLPLSEAPKLTLMAAVAAADAVQKRTGLTVRIKWPNDILVNGRKLAGILTEIGTEMDSLDFAVIGLGLNVNIPRGSFPPGLRTPATSVLIEKGEPFPRIFLLRAWLEELEKTTPSSARAISIPSCHAGKSWRTLWAAKSPLIFRAGGTPEKSRKSTNTAF